MNYGCCLVCKTPIESGAVVVAEVFDGLPVSFAHAQCFIESAMPASFIDPRQTVLVESGFGLNAIGAMGGVDLPRHAAETDTDYRGRLMVRLSNPLGSELETPINHVRDAVLANQ